MYQGATHCIQIWGAGRDKGAQHEADVLAVMSADAVVNTGAASALAAKFDLVVLAGGPHHHEHCLLIAEIHKAACSSGRISC